MDRRLQIGQRWVGEGEPAFCIAEVGINHNGDLQQAMKMIDAAKAMGADAVKFQTFKAEEFCGDPAQTYTYQSQGRSVTEPMLQMFKRHEFGVDQWRAIKRHCDSAGIVFLSTPQNIGDLQLLLELGIPAVKIGSDDFTNLPQIRRYREAGLPLLLSCGMSDMAEVHQALDAAGWFEGRPVVLLLCTSQYPTPAEDVNVAKLTTLRQGFPGLVTGFSDHSQGRDAAMLARALGACVFEKHFTLDHGLPGPDHWFSEEPRNLRAWLDGIRLADVLLGDPRVRPTPAEMEMRTLARRSVVALRDIAAGEALTEENIGLRRPGGGLSPDMLQQALGLVAAVPIRAGQKLRLGEMMANGERDAG
ncbi:N-acetylneuraminate synthase [Chromobacterium phragmitis]|uniref:N-acetylneuraminate synthase n=1 Tax=Chromobacterium phragmitis TaxID=2202141 RepID=A0A344UH45_9NEIS|nr:N-acetylneuraminate synthase family protein [Chromobacterium phragmitis]AXE29234.1 N-acetylneuraminate synthase [Chromobacterium phragmitis]AXE34593.1 N-acetylneuraminate synthase [Chromobacterium phragmitis]